MPTDPIYKTKEGQQVTHRQLVASGYDEDRIKSGLSNGILKQIGDTNAPEQMFNTKDGQKVSYKDLIDSGYSEERINNGVQNGILMAEEPKKKVGSVAFPTLSGSEPPLQSQEDVIEMDKQAQQLAKKTVFQGGTEGGVEVRDKDAIAQAEELNKKIQEKGYKPGELSIEFKDFPEEAFSLPDETGKPKYSKENLLQLRKSNPIEYQSTINNLKTTFDLAKAAGTGVANDFNKLHIESTHLPEFEAKIKGQQDIINTHLSGDQRDKAIERLQQTASSFIDPSNQAIVRDYDEHPELKSVLDINQYAGLKTLQLFNKPMYDQAVQALGTSIPERQMPESVGGGLEQFKTNAAPVEQIKTLKGELQAPNTINQKIGKESILKNLADIGRSNALISLNRKQYNIDNQWKSSNDENEKANLQAQYIINQSQIDNINKDRTNDLDKYPLVSRMKLDNLAKELNGSPEYSAAGYGLRKFSHGFESTGETIEDKLTDWFGSDNASNRLKLQRMGEQMGYNSEMYLPENLKQTGSDIIPQFSKSIKEKGDAISNDNSLSDYEKKHKLRDLISEGLKDGEVDFVTNPNAGKSKNFFSKATVYGNAGLLGDIASVVAQSLGLGAMGASRTLAATAPMFTTTYSDFYNQALLNGEANPEGQAMVHASIMAAAGLINPDLSIVKRSLGAGSPLGKIIAGVDEATWNSVISENKPLLNKFINSAKSVGKEATKMALTYGVGTSIASDLADKGFFNKDISTEDIINHAIEAGKNIIINSASLLGLNAITNFKGVPITERAKLWEAADNKDITFQQIDEAVKSKQITEEQGNQRKKVVEDISKLIETVPTTNEKGEPLTDKQRVNYLYNLYIKSKAKDLQKSSPEDQKDILDGKIAQADAENNTILTGKKPKLIQIDPKDEKTFTYDSEKDIPEVLSGTKPIKTEEIEGEGGKKIKVTYSGQQLIDAGLAEKPRIRVSAEQMEQGQPDKEKLFVEGDGSLPPSGAEEPIATAEEKKTGIKNAVSRDTRLDLKLSPIELPKIGSDMERLAEGKRAVDSGEINPSEVVNNVLEGKGKIGMQPKEAAAMQYYMHQLGRADELLQQQLGQDISPEERLSLVNQRLQLNDLYDRATEANMLAGTAWSDVGNTRQILVDNSFNASRDKAIIKDAYGGEIPKDVQEKLDAALKERDEAIQARAKLEEQLRQKEAEGSAANMKKGRSATSKTDYAAKRKSLLEDLKKAKEEHEQWLKDNGIQKQGLGFSLTGKMIKIIGEYAKTYFDQGAEKLSEVIDRVFDELKDAFPGIDKTHIRDAIALHEAGKLNKKAEGLEKKIEDDNVPITTNKLKLKFQNNNEWVKANQRVYNAEYKVKGIKRQALNSDKSFIQRGFNWGSKLVRFSVLSGVNVLYKLAAAATIGGAIKRIPEQIIGQMWSTIFRGISKKAPIEGFTNAKAEANFYKDFFNPKKFVKNSWQIIKGNESDLTRKYGDATYGKAGKIPLPEKTPESIKKTVSVGGQILDRALSLPTDLHQVIKDPVKRATFEASFKNGMVWAERNGLDITDPLVVSSIETAAYKRANYEIFLEKNKLTDAFNNFKTKMEKSGNVGSLGKLVADFFIPVSTVPVNIARRLITTSPVGMIRGGAKVIQAYRKGIENLSNDQADAVMRQLKQGSLGTALWLIGWFGASHFGGMYSKFDPNKKRKEGELTSDEMEINGEMIPKPVQHAQPLEVIQWAATMRHIYDNYKENKGESTFPALLKAGLGAIGSLAEQIPVIETPVHLVNSTHDPYEENKLEEDIKRRFEPQFLKDTGLSGHKKGSLEMLKDKYSDSDKLFKNDLKAYDKNGRPREITTDEFKDYKKVRDEEIGKGIENAYNNGVLIGEKGNVVTKKWDDLTDEQQRDEITRIKLDATEKVKKQLFGQEQKTPNEVIEGSLLKGYREIEKLKNQ